MPGKLLPSDPKQTAEVGNLSALTHHTTHWQLTHICPLPSSLATYPHLPQLTDNLPTHTLITPNNSSATYPHLHTKHLTSNLPTLTHHRTHQQLTHICTQLTLTCTSQNLQATYPHWYTTWLTYLPTLTHHITHRQLTHTCTTQTHLRNASSGNHPITNMHTL